MTENDRDTLTDSKRKQEEKEKDENLRYLLQTQKSLFGTNDKPDEILLHINLLNKKSAKK